MSARRQVSLPEELCAAVEKRFCSRFGSFEELLEFVLKEIADTNTDSLDQAEQEMIEKRLRDLGYM